MARQLAARRQDLIRSIYFVFWDSHEVAGGTGSTYFVGKYWDRITRGCIAYTNCDDLASRGATVPTTESNREMKRYLQGLLRCVRGTPGHWIEAYKGGGDSSFFGVGVPIFPSLRNTRRSGSVN
ncbi:MAG: M28 family peptidase [bacterium]